MGARLLKNTIIWYNLLMNNTYTDKRLEEFLQKYFAVKIKIEEVIVRNMPVSYSTEAFVFRSKNGKVYAFIHGESKFTLGDVQKITSKMNLRMGKVFPPSGQKDYFTSRAKAQFLQIFPSRDHVLDEELRFYKTRVAYNPALIEVAEVKNGEIKGFNPDSIGSWRVVKRLNYRKII